MNVNSISVEKAVSLSLNGRHKSAISAFRSILKDNDILPAYVVMEAAYAHDRGGKEHKAITLYRRALKGDLTDTQRVHVYFCLASSYRNIGRAKTAYQSLRKAVRQSPNEPILKMLLAILDHDEGRSGLAIYRLLSVCYEHIQDEKITSYMRFLKREAHKAKHP